MSKITSLERFHLMLFKNFTSQSHRKCEIFVVILISLTFVPVMIAIRYWELPYYENKIKFEPVSIVNLNLFKHWLQLLENRETLYLAYSPKNALYDNIMDATVKKLKLSGVRAFPTSKEMIKYLYNASYMAGIDFDDRNAKITQYPLNFTFAIIMNSILRTDPIRDKPHSWNTANLFPSIYELEERPPRNIKDNDGGIPVGYIREGFIPLQHAIVLKYLKHYSNHTKWPAINMKRFSYPKRRVDPMELIINFMLPICMIFIYLCPSYYMARRLTAEREKGLRSIMRIMGVYNLEQWAGWFVYFFIFQLLLTVVSTLLLTYKWSDNESIYNHSEWVVIVWFMCSYLVSNITFTFLLGVIFMKTKTATIYAGVIHFSTYMIFLFASLFYDSLGTIGQVAICLFLNTGLTMGIHIILNYESTGEGIQWDNYMIPPTESDHIGLGHVHMTLIVSAILHMIVCLYVEDLNLGHENDKKWYYPLQLGYWRGRYFIPVQEFAPSPDPNRREIPEKQKIVFSQTYTPMPLTKKDAATQTPRHRPKATDQNLLKVHVERISETDEEMLVKEPAPAPEPEPKPELEPEPEPELEPQHETESKVATKIETEVEMEVVEESLPFEIEIYSTEFDETDPSMNEAFRGESEMEEMEEMEDEYEEEMDSSKKLQKAKRVVSFHDTPIHIYDDTITIDSLRSILNPEEEEVVYDTHMPTYFDDTISVESLEFPENEEPTVSPLPDSELKLVDPEREDEVGVRIIDLYKNLGARYVLQGITLDCYENEILVFLGLESAGKTTLTKILVGFMPITKGAVIISGHDIRTNLKEARVSLGLLMKCNNIYDSLSTRDHLYLYSRLRGVPEGRKVYCEVRKYLQKLNLYDMADIPAGKLSSGIKRQLSLCCALCGGAKVLICDEPTEGMDRRNRYKFWDILKSEKQGRTIIVTTESCDEANFLGDRIAVLYGGKIVALGTPKELQHRYLSHYYLTCGKRHSDCDVEKVITLLRKYIATAEVHYNDADEFQMRIPADEISKFPEMLRDLENNYVDLKLVNYRVRIYNLEDVFMRIRYIHQQHYEISAKRKPKGLTKTLDSRTREYDEDKIDSLQWQAIFYKKKLLILRHCRLVLVSMLALPFMLALLLIFRFNKITYSLHLPPITIDVNQYENVILAVQMDRSVQPQSIEESLIKHYKHWAKERNIPVIKIPAKKNIDIYMEYRFRIARKQTSNTFLAAILAKHNQIQVLWNNYPLHTAPLSLSILHKSMVKLIRGPNADIHCINRPLAIPPQQHYQNLRTITILTMGMPFCIVIAMCLELAVLAIPVIRERISDTKMLQLMSGINVPVYWTSQFLWDYFKYTMAVMLFIIFLFFLQLPYYNTVSDLWKMLLILMLFGFAGLPFTYLLTFLFDSILIGFLSIFFIGLSTSIFLVLALVALERWNIFIYSGNEYYILNLFPMMNFYLCLKGMYAVNDLKEACEKFKQQENKIATANICMRDISTFDLEWPGILIEILIMLLGAFVLFMLLFFRESALYGKLCKCRIHRKKSKQPDTLQIDDDVFVEQRRANSLSAPSMQKLPLVVKSLCKSYGKTKAVQNISFMIRPDECFGVVGVNGAGKTTLIKMLTGRYRIDSGDAFIRGLSIRKDYGDIFMNIGYFPMTYCVFDDLTGRETLRMFCILKAVKKQFINEICEELGAKFELTAYLDEIVKNYSLRSKRNLNAAITVLEEPKIILMDEPSINIDPAEREKMWHTVATLREYGHSVMIATKSIAECEAICTRMAIMVKGHFKCFGTVAHLKHKFSKGFTLKIYLARVNRTIQFDKSNETLGEEPTTFNRSTTTSTESLEYVYWQKKAKLYRSLRQFFDKALPDIKLKGQYDNCFIYFLPLNQFTAWMIFGIMEAIKDEFNVEHYTISQTHLENIFRDINLTQSHTEEQQQSHSMRNYLKRIVGPPVEYSYDN